MTAQNDMMAPSYHLLLLWVHAPLRRHLLLHHLLLGRWGLQRTAAAQPSSTHRTTRRASFTGQHRLEQRDT